MSHYITGNRMQLQWQTLDFERLIPKDHDVRLFWEICEKLDLSELYKDYKITRESEGRPAYDPVLLLCLWCYGYSQGIQTSRELAEACKFRADFMWLCGGETPEYRVLAYFRTNHTKAMESAFCKLILTLKKTNLIKMKTFFQDGSKIRADASKSSFKKKDRLEAEWEEAKSVYEEFVYCNEKETNITKIGKKIKGIEKAIKRVEKIAEKRKRMKKAEREKYPPEEAKASTTDCECQFMKFNNSGASLPGYNVQICVDYGSEFIVGKEVSNEPTDVSRLIPVVKDVKKKLEIESIDKYVTDSGYYKDENIEEAGRENVNLILSVYNESKNKRVEKVKRTGESEEGKKMLRLRSETIERIYGFIKEKGFKFRRFNLRGLIRVGCEWTIICFAYNIFRYIQLMGNA